MNTPKNQLLCIHKNCELANECIRHIQFKSITDDDIAIRIVNPNIVTQTASCPYFSTIVTNRYAKGFRNIFPQIPSGIANTIYHKLSSHFGKNPYYDRRNGKTLISPQEQIFIRSVFASHGIVSEVFDEYEEKEEWGRLSENHFSPL